MTNSIPASVINWYRRLQPSGVFLFYCLIELTFGFAVVLAQRPTEKGTVLLWSAAWF